MRITSFNANGLRSATSKGFFDWFAAHDSDILCIQETKAQEHQLQAPEFDVEFVARALELGQLDEQLAVLVAGEHHGNACGDVGQHQ